MYTQHGEKSLFDMVVDDELKDSRITKFEDFHRDNPHVYEMFAVLALQASRKRTRFSAQTILFVIRWKSTVRTDDPAGFKINNNWAPFYSRMFIRDYPEHWGLFENRESVADEGGS